MDIFEYLPQPIVAYDGNDEFANLIHVKKAVKDINYYCPCCGQIVKPRTLDSDKELSHFYHITGKCTKESQLHFFCKNWLFNFGSRFYIDNKLFEVISIDIEKIYATPFGDYRPDITVYTSSGKTIFFEMFFTNRKTGDDYFCKWNALKNDVVEVNIREYMFKTDENVIPTFTYLYHDEICYSKTYIKKDLYANTIAMIKRELTKQKVLNYKTRIKQLDWFWIQIQNNVLKKTILENCSQMAYDDMVSCYEIIKRKHSVAYLKDDLLKLINQKVIRDIGKTLDLPKDENIYFDLKQHYGRTYEFGIRLNITLPHIIFNDFYKRCSYKESDFDKTIGYPKVIFKKNIFSYDEINIPQNKISELIDIFNETVEYKKTLIAYEKKLYDFESQKGYRIRVKNNFYTVIKKTDNDCYDVILDHYQLNSTDINILNTNITDQLIENAEKKFLNLVKNRKQYCELLQQLNNYNGLDSKISIDYKYPYYGHEKGIYFNLWLYGYQTYLKKVKPSEDDFLNTLSECQTYMDNFKDQHSIIFEVISKINNCKNRLWNVEFNIDHNGISRLFLCINICPHIYNNHYLHKNIYLSDMDLSNRKNIIHLIKGSMKELINELEYYGYRIWFEGRR